MNQKLRIYLNGKIEQINIFAKDGGPFYDGQMSSDGETASELALIPRGTSFLAAAISAGCATQVLAMPVGHRPAPTNGQNKNVNKINDKTGLNEPSTCLLILLDPFTPCSFIYLSCICCLSILKIQFQRIYYNNLKKISKCHVTYL